MENVVATVDMGAANPFMTRQHKDAKQWAKEKNCKDLRNSTSSRNGYSGKNAGIPRKRGSGTARFSKDLQKIAEAMIAMQAAGASPSRATGTVSVVVDIDAALYKTYGLCPMDMDRMLTMCGLKSGQEDRLPEWITTVAMANLSKGRRRTAV